MNMMIYTDDAQLITTYYDPEAPAPKKFFIWFENVKEWVIANPGESSAATWQRVLADVRYRRKHFQDGLFKDLEWKRPGYLRGNPYRHAHVFAGIDMPKELDRQLFKRWAIWWCVMMGSETRNPDHDARVAALILACKLEGLDAPQRTQVHITVR